MVNPSGFLLSRLMAFVLYCFAMLGRFFFFFSFLFFFLIVFVLSSIIILLFIVWGWADSLYGL